MTRHQQPVAWLFFSTRMSRRFLLTAFAAQGIAMALLYALCGMLFLAPSHITPGLLVFIAGQVVQMFLTVFGAVVTTVAVQDTVIARSACRQNPPDPEG